MSNFASEIPVIGGLFDDSDERMLDELRKNGAIWDELALPEYKEYRPELYDYAGDLNVEEAQATQIQDDPVARSRQENLLLDLAGLAETGHSDADRAGFARAGRAGDALAASRMGADLQNAQARGVAGGGMEFALRQGANQAGAERAQELAEEQAMSAANQRMLYQQAYGNALSGVRDQDYRTQANNANILNEFNRANTQTRNDAQQWNLQNRQTIGNARADQTNDAQKYHNDLQDRAFDARYKKTAGRTGANTDMAGGYAAQNAARTDSRNANTALLVGAAAKYASGGKKPEGT